MKHDTLEENENEKEKKSKISLENYLHYIHTFLISCTLSKSIKTNNQKIKKEKKKRKKKNAHKIATSLALFL